MKGMTYHEDVPDKCCHHTVKKCKCNFVGLEVFTEVGMKCTILWGMTLCSQLSCLPPAYLLNHFFDPEDGGDLILRNVGCNSTDYTASYPTR
jgi:hypothetical protein